MMRKRVKGKKSVNKKKESEKKIESEKMREKQKNKQVFLLRRVMSRVLFIQTSLYLYFCTKRHVLILMTSVAILGNFVKVFLNKYKLHNVIKRKFYILIITTIKKHANT